MSSKKIIRLKTPTKLKEYLKTPESTFAHTRFNVLDSITEIQQQEYTESIHLALINEVNKLYKEIETLKKKIVEEERINDDLCKEKKRLRLQMQILEKESASHREMYELQRHNHQRLREFYEQREKEWQQIVLQHKQMLEEYDQKYNTSLSDIRSEELLFAINSKEKIQGQEHNRFESQKQLPYKIEAKEIKRLKRLSLQNKVNSDMQGQGPQAYYITEISRLYTEEKQFTKKSEFRSSNTQSQNKGQTHRNPQADELFDRIMRKTYCCLKQQAKSINGIKESEDMVKLRHAKTSTKERLIKTVKKLDFQVKSERELLDFCDYIEQQVLNREKMLRGDLVCDFIIEKLHECEKLALSSNSEIEKIEASMVEAGWERVRLDVQRMSRDNLQLLLNSTIKQPPQVQSTISQNIRYSISSLQNLSDLIHGETLAQQGSD